MNQHATAIVDRGAQIAQDVSIGPYAIIEKDVHIAEGCAIGPHAVIHAGTTLGAGCRVHAGVVLGDEPQEIAFTGCRSFVKIGRNCVLREGVTIHRGTEENTATTVGDECFLMVNSHIGHNSQVGDRVIMANGALLAGRVEIGDGVFVSGNSGVHQFVKIGRLAMLSGVAGASKDVPPFCTIHGATINKISGLNTIGMRRGGITPAQRREVQRVFKMICASHLNVAQALQELDRETLAGPAAEFVEFVRGSKRGICRVG